MGCLIQPETKNSPYHEDYNYQKSNILKYIYIRITQ